ncbi:MAG: mechanosensitive channel MscK [Porticoccaceae bacterium]
MTLLRALLTFAITVLIAVAAAGETAQESRTRLEKSLALLPARNLPEAEQRTARQALEQALAHLASLEEHERQRKALAAQIAAAPARILEKRRELADIKASAPPDASRAPSSDLAQLTQELADRSAQRDVWQQELRDANSQILAAQTSPERIQSQIGSHQTRISDIENLLQASRDGASFASAETVEALRAEKRDLEARIQLQRLELENTTLLQEMAQARRDLLMARIEHGNSEIDALQALISDVRREQSEQTIAKLQRSEGPVSANALLARENATDLELSRLLLETTDRRDVVAQRNLRTQQLQEQLTQQASSLDEMVDVLDGSLLLGRILNELKRSLPTVDIDDSLADRIADIRLQQFELGQRLEQANHAPAYVDSLLTQAARDDNLGDDLRQALVEQVTSRAALIEQVNRELSALLNESILLQLAQVRLQTTADSLHKRLEEQMFWVPSHRPLGRAWLRALPERVYQQVAGIPWVSASSEFVAGLHARPLIFLPLLVVIAGLLWRRKWLAARIEALGSDLGHAGRDSPWHTPLAVLLTVLQALPGTLFLALCGYALQMDARGQNASFGAALVAMAQVWLVFYTAHRVLLPGGIAERHFRWPPHQVTFLRRHLRRLGILVLALAAVATVAEHQPAALSDDSLGILVVLVGYFLMAALLLRLVTPSARGERLSLSRLAFSVALVLLPLTLLAAVVMGYYYTALKLTTSLIYSLFLLVLWRLALATLVRSLEVAAQKLARQRVVQQRSAEIRETPEGSEIVVEDEPALDIKVVNQQSLRLVKLGLMIAFAVAFYWVWADFIPLLAYLDNIALYHYSSGSGDGARLASISVRDLLGALVIVAISVALARNLPGLLEVMVLSRLRLSQGSTYATTTLLSYVIVSVGFVATLGALGVSWDKLQWLVAALGVGLGFGLQEIFANFVSGLIILFERPVRIGDVVTIGDRSGVVKRIRIRTTTITDSDRKDIIIPNKTFITGQLTNWSLTDTVTRLTIRIGVAYGSDLAKTRELLLRAAAENPRVLRDPAPAVYFINFGTDTLDHELLIHVGELGDRSPATDEVNRHIEELFRESGIEIAFRQVDVRVHSVDGQELKIPGRYPQDKPHPDSAT